MPNKERKSAVLRILLLTILLFFLVFFLKGTEYIFLLLFSAFIHECGHILTAKILSVPFVRVRSGLFGLWMKYDFSVKSYLTEIIVSCFGAAFNVCAAALTLFLCRPFGLLPLFFVFSNLSLAVFNLMPVSGFDGIGILHCLILTLTGDVSKADKACRIVSAVFSGAFFLLTVYIQMRAGAGLSLMLLSVFLLYNCFFGKNNS